MALICRTRLRRLGGAPSSDGGPARLGAVLALMCSGAPGAHATDISGAAPPAVNWSGVYAGLQAGYTGGHDHLVELVTASGAPTGSVYDYAPSGFTGGGHIGADAQIGKVVFGVVTDVEGASVRGNFMDPTGIGRGSDNLPWRGSFRGRVGYSLGRLLVYATGGLGYTGLQTTYVFVPAGVAEQRSHVLAGPTFGGGLAYALTDHWSVSAEYRHTEYGRLLNPSTVAFPGFTGAHQLRTDAGIFGVSYRF